MAIRSRRAIGPIHAYGKEVRLARKTRIPLAYILTRGKEVRARFLDSQAGDREVVLPATVLKLLQVILYELGRGRGVTLLIERAEMTTQQAAHALNISRHRLLKLLDDGEIPYHWVGSHRRILAEDVLHYGNLWNDRPGTRPDSRTLDQASIPSLMESIQEGK